MPTSLFPLALAARLRAFLLAALLLATAAHAPAQVITRAAAGDAQAQLELAIWFEEGIHGMAQNEDEAIKWYTRAAEQNHAEAALGLAALYEARYARTLAKKEADAAAHWYRRAADLGDPIAQYNIATYLERGLGVPKNEWLALEFYKKSAAQGDADAKQEARRLEPIVAKALEDTRADADAGDPAAQYNVALWHYEGTHGTAQNTAEALNWFTRAAEQAHREAIYKLIALYTDATEVEKNEDALTRWRHKAADLGDAEAQYQLALYYDNKNDDLALVYSLLKQAAASGHKEAEKIIKNARSLMAEAEMGNSGKLSWIGFHYYDDSWKLGKPQTYIEALKWFKRAAIKGDTYAMVAIGYMYGKGMGVKENHEAATNWYTQAAQQDESYGLYNLGINYRDGLGGLEKNKWTAAKLFKKAAKKENESAVKSLQQLEPELEAERSDLIKRAEEGDAAAQYELAFWYETGEGGVEADDAKANRWYKRAAESGHPEAQFLVFRAYTEEFLGLSIDYSEALKWAQRLAAQDDIRGTAYLAARYALGAYDAERNPTAAIQWYQKTAEIADLNNTQDRKALIRLVELFQNGPDDLPKADPQPLAQYKESLNTRRDALIAQAKTDDAEAQYQLGLWYLREGHYANDLDAGKDRAWIDENSDSCLYWFERAANQNHVAAAHELATFYARYKKSEAATAAMWLRKAADLGDAESQYWLARYYESGEAGYPKDERAAFELYKKASEIGQENHPYYEAALREWARLEEQLGLLKEAVRSLPIQKYL